MTSLSRNVCPLWMESLTHILNHVNFIFRMLGLLIRYYLYFIDNNHDLDVDLMFFNVAIKVKVNAFYPRALTAQAQKKNYASPVVLWSYFS